MKFKLLAVSFLNRSSQIIIYGLVFLLPIFFLPWTSDILDFNKQLLLSFFVSLALFFWLLKSFIVGQFKFNLNRFSIVVGVLFLAYLLSNIFSVSPYKSFWGNWPIFSQSFLSIVFFVLLYFLVNNIFSEREIFISFISLALSALLVQLYGIFQLLGFYILPFVFSHNSAFNTLGSVESLGLFSVLLILLSIVMLPNVKKWQKMLFAADLFLGLIVLLLVNYHYLWFMVILGTGLIILFWIVRQDVFGGNFIFVPIFFFSISLFFIIFNPSLSFLAPQTSEISLSPKTNLEIDLKVLRERPLFGSGVGTFYFDFAKFKDKDFNENILWNVTFSSGSSKILTEAATIGIVGLLSWFLVMIFSMVKGVNYLVSGRLVKDNEKIPLVLGILVILFAQSLGYFFYNSNISLDFIYFFCLSIFSVLTFKNNKNYILKSLLLQRLSAKFIFIFVFIFVFGLLTLEGQRYLADINYNKGIVNWQNGDRDQAIEYLKKSASTNPKLDVYFNKLALFSFLKLQDLFSKVDNNVISDEERNKIETSISYSLANIDKAIRLDSSYFDNWASKGYICHNLIGLYKDAQICALNSYDKAIELSPTNPYLFVQEGNVYLIEASRSTLENRNQLLLKARDKFNKAIDLKKDYAPAYLQLALSFGMEDNSKDKLTALQEAQKYFNNDSSLAFQIGLVYYQDRNWKTAEEWFKKALLFVPDYADSLYYLGLTYQQQGQQDKSIEIFSKLLELNPNNKDIQKILDNLNKETLPVPF